jgi:LCP family protein required for cell wall assembly
MTGPASRIGGRRALLAALGGIGLLGVALVAWIAVAQPFAADPTPTPVAQASPTPTLAPTPSPTAPPTPTPTPTPTPSPTPTPRPAALDDGRFTVLILGSDDSAGRRNRRPTGEYLTDAITVVSVTENGRRLALFSLPRDTVDLRLPDGSVWGGKVNTISFYRGPEAMRGAMSILLGIPIDHYAQVDMDDFQAIVRAAGGVRVRVPYYLHDSRCTFLPGRRELNSKRALCYARHRYSDSDWARAGRHQQLLLALRDRFVQRDIPIRSVLRNLGSLRTDLPFADIPAYADLVDRTRNAKVTRIVLAPPAFTTFVGISGDRGWIQVPNVAAIQAAVAEALRR